MLWSLTGIVLLIDPCAHPWQHLKHNLNLFIKVVVKRLRAPHNYNHTMYDAIENAF